MTDTQDQINNTTPVSVHLHPAPEVKYCTKCKNELLVVDNIRHTRFGLDLCEDCLYS